MTTNLIQTTAHAMNAKGGYNYFDANFEAFNEAAAYIKRHCISFAGHGCRATNSPLIFNALARTFCNADPAMVECFYECVAFADCYRIPCYVGVTVDAKVRFISKEWADEHGLN